MSDSTTPTTAEVDVLHSAALKYVGQREARKAQMRKVLLPLILISLEGQKGEEAGVLLQFDGFSDSSLPGTPSAQVLRAENLTMLCRRKSPNCRDVPRLASSRKGLFAKVASHSSAMRIDDLGKKRALWYSMRRRVICDSDNSLGFNVLFCQFLFAAGDLGGGAIGVDWSPLSDWENLCQSHLTSGVFHDVLTLFPSSMRIATIRVITP
jgi:hypothetical protein